MTGLVLSGISHGFGGMAVLDDVSFDVAEGEVTVLVGPSGCGKSTLLGIAGGLLRAERGTVAMTGAAGEGCLNPLTYVFQDFALLPWRTVAGNISLVLEGTGLSARARQARIAEVLETTGLAGFADAWPKQLSGGMRQRVGIARALAVRPAVLLMDEPLSALDSQTRDLLLDEFAALIAARGMTVLYVTHHLAEAVRLGHRVVVMSRRPGRIKEIIPIAVPLQARRADDPALIAVEQRLWALIRDDAAAADREVAHG